MTGWLIAGAWLGLLAVVAGAVTPSALWRVLRRVLLRARWRSVARSAGLAVTRDRVDGERVEHLPSIRWGRALPGGRGVRYRLRPARGGTISDVAEAAERLAAGLHVHRVEVERHRADRGHLTVLWGDSLAGVVAPPTTVEMAS